MSVSHCIIACREVRWARFVAHRDKPFSCYEDASDEPAPFLSRNTCGITFGLLQLGVWPSGTRPFLHLSSDLHLFPYFSTVVVGDPVRGQSLIGYINASVGLLLAATILFSAWSPTPSANENPGSSSLTEPSLWEDSYYGGSSPETRDCLFIQVSL